MTENHPITPPDELVEEWIQSTRSNDCIGSYPENYEYLVAARAARWGADQELQACCEFLDDVFMPTHAKQLYANRRPKPLLSLREQALMLLEPIGRPHAELGAWKALRPEEVDTIRRALEQLND